VRRFFIENALCWVTEFHIDALRLDAVHAILDRSAVPFLKELAEAVHRRAEQLNRRIYVMAESDLNDTRFFRPPELDGYGLDALWNEDFHHALHVKDLATAFAQGYVYQGQYSPFRRCCHGSPSRDVPAHRFVVFAQNHDQVGNRILGQRLSQLISFEALKLAAAVVLLSPYIPLLFMGEEYGEIAPFQYFISHSDAELVEAVRQGRRKEFAAFAWQGEPPDPQDEATFLRSKLDHNLRSNAHHRRLLEFYKELIRLRKELPALASLSKEEMEVKGSQRERVLLLRRWRGNSEVFAAFNFADTEDTTALRVPGGRWRKQLDSAEERWQGRGSSVPDILTSEGEAIIRLGAKTVTLFVKEYQP